MKKSKNIDITAHLGGDKHFSVDSKSYKKLTVVEKSYILYMIQEWLLEQKKDITQKASSVSLKAKGNKKIVQSVLSITRMEEKSTRGKK